LPLEIREAIRVRPCEKILLSVSSVEEGKLIMELARAPDNLESYAYSRNGAYVKSKKRCKYEK
jgi:hypothetical protein